MTSENIIQEKKIQRVKFKLARKNYSIVNQRSESRLTCELLLSIFEKHNCKHLVSYMAMPGEVITTACTESLWESGQEVWLPKTGEQTLSWHPISNTQQLNKGPFNILEPNQTLVPAQELPAKSLCVIPGLAFTAEGDRLGMGKGYYDRVLSQMRSLDCYIVGVGYRNQLATELATEEHDKALPHLIIGGQQIK